MKSICLIVQNPYPADIRVRKYAQVLHKRGHRVTVIATRWGGERYHEYVDGAEVFRLIPRKRRGGKLLYLLDYFVFFCLAFLQLNLLDFRRRFDVIHVNTLPDFLVFCAWIQKLAGRTIVLDMHEVMPEFFISKYHVRPESRAVRLLMHIEKASIKFADTVITVNHSLKQLFEDRDLPKRSVVVIMNTVDSSVIRRYNRQVHDDFNCVYHGTIIDIYGLDLAIAAFARARSSYTSGRMIFHIFGSGSQVPALREIVRDLKIEDSVIFHGAIWTERIWQKLAEMDLGILACRKDIFVNLSFSNKLAEYIFLGIPVIHSDLDSIRHYFDDREILYFRSGDVEELSRKICYARDHREAMKGRADAASARYASIDWGVMAQRYIDLIEGDEDPKPEEQLSMRRESPEDS